MFWTILNRLLPVSWFRSEVRHTWRGQLAMHAFGEAWWYGDRQIGLEYFPHFQVYD